MLLQITIDDDGLTREDVVRILKSIDHDAS